MAVHARSRVFQVCMLAGVLAILAAGAAAVFWRGEIWRTALDPKQPFQTYRPPPPPDYARPAAWALLPADPARPAPGDPPADVFFLHPTTYDGGRDWNGPIDEPRSTRLLARTVLPNYAGPFQRVGRVFAPRYRQASLYTFLTLRDDAQEARRFAYRDVRAAFDAFLRRSPSDRPIVLAGVGQGGSLLDHLLQERVNRDPALLKRVAAVYLIDTVSAADEFGATAPLPACARRDEARCVVGWTSIHRLEPARVERRLDRALLWTPDGRLEHLNGRRSLCVNPLTGASGGELAGAKLNQGAANASGLEWGVRPAFLPHQVSAQCVDGLLHVSDAASPSLQRAGSWTDRRKSPGYNLFYADIEADAQARVQALLGKRMFGPPAPPIVTSVVVGSSPIHRID